MSFAGTVIDMIKRQRMNRELQKQNRHKFADRKEALLTHSSKKTFNTEKFPPKSQAEIDRIQAQVRAELKQEQRAIFLKTAVVFLLLCALLYWGLS